MRITSPTTNQSQVMKNVGRLAANSAWTMADCDVIENSLDHTTTPLLLGLRVASGAMHGVGLTAAITRQEVTTANTIAALGHGFSILGACTLTQSPIIGGAFLLAGDLINVAASIGRFAE